MLDIYNTNIPFLVKDLSENNSEQALKLLYGHYFDKLMRFVSIYVKSEPVAEEIVGDVFLEIWESRKSLLKIQNFNAYIYTVSRNKSIDFLRTNKFSYDQLDDYPLELFSSTDTTPEDDLISKELTSKLNDAIESLPSQCKIAFKLIREENLNYKDAAQILNVSVKTLEAHITKAVKTLRLVLKPSA